MASVQLNFTLRTTPTVKTVHLLGSWDNYQGQLPMSRDSAKKSSSGAWTGTFRFQPGSLKAGSRYWYYYIMDGYHVTHDPAREAVVEPTTQRKLNILDIPVSTKAKATAAVASPRSRHSRRESALIAKGRSLSPSQIKCPRPQRPGQTKQITTESYTQASLEEIEARLGRATLDDSDDSDSDSDDDSDCPSLSRSSNASSPSNLSSASDSSSCTCERYGITRAGNRIKLDCGGDRCGSSEDSCNESDNEEVYHARATRRNGIIVRGH